jgi:hypothetical protein
LAGDNYLNSFHVGKGRRKCESSDVRIAERKWIGKEYGGKEGKI